MQGERIGYIRVSTIDQNSERQLEGIEVAKTFTDKASGKDTKRPQLEELMSFVCTGDKVVLDPVVCAIFIAAGGRHPGVTVVEALAIVALHGPT